jgi:protein-tyrosine-phosphatase
MAQALLERLLAARGASGVRVRAGGIAAYARDGMLPSLDARLVLRELGIELTEAGPGSVDLRRHPEQLAEADLIVTMTEPQKAAVATLPAARGRPVWTLRELAGEPGDIADPAGQGEAGFRACRDEIRRCLEQGLDRLLAALEPARG